jgi:hypothetical protein
VFRIFQGRLLSSPNQRAKLEVWSPGTADVP